jgi:hypothetical protein
VAKPARSEWPARSLVSMPAAAARRLITSVTDCAVRRRPASLTVPVDRAEQRALVGAEHCQPGLQGRRTG